MDGFMAIPGILFAMGLVALVGPGLVTVILAIVITDIPRVARLAPGRVSGMSCELRAGERQSRVNRKKSRV
jgi:peptide/nickel transport system permease protein